MIKVPASFIIAPKYKQLKFPSTNEWTNKMRAIRSTEYYSQIKSNEVLAYITTWMGIGQFYINRK